MIVTQLKQPVAVKAIERAKAMYDGKIPSHWDPNGPSIQACPVSKLTITDIVEVTETPQVVTTTSQNGTDIAYNLSRIRPEADDYSKILSTYNPEDLLCIVTIPPIKNRRERWTTASELQADKWRKFLRFANSQGSSIYLSVYSYTAKRRTEDNVTDTVDRVFLDFDHDEAYRAFMDDFKDVSICIKTSPGKHQVLLLLSEHIPKAEAKAISKALSAKYQADHCFDLARIFRFPSFRNRKYSDSPLASIKEFRPEITWQSFNLPIKAEPAELTKSPAAVPSQERTAPAVKAGQLRDYSYFANRAPVKMSGGPDYSSADFAFAVYLSGQGKTVSEIVDSLRAESPNIQKRKGASLDGYLKKTAERAQIYQQKNFKPYNNGRGRA